MEVAQTETRLGSLRATHQQSVQQRHPSPRCTAAGSLRSMLDAWQGGLCDNDSLDCSVCLLDIEANAPKVAMKCCGAPVHLDCLAKCVGTWTGSDSVIDTA